MGTTPITKTDTMASDSDKSKAVDGEPTSVGIKLEVIDGALQLPKNFMQFINACADIAKAKAGKGVEKKLVTVLMGRVTHKADGSVTTTGVLPVSASQVDSVRERMGITVLRAASTSSSAYKQA